MSDTIAAYPSVMPSATPSEEDIRAWEALPRDEQLRRMRALLTSAACTTMTDRTMDDILAEARRRADAVSNG